MRTERAEAPGGGAVSGMARRARGMRPRLIFGNEALSGPAVHAGCAPEGGASRRGGAVSGMCPSERLCAARQGAMARPRPPRAPGPALFPPAGCRAILKGRAGRQGGGRLPQHGAPAGRTPDLTSGRICPTQIFLRRARACLSSCPAGADFRAAFQKRPSHSLLNNWSIFWKHRRKPASPSSLPRSRNMRPISCPCWRISPNTANSMKL